MTGSLSYFVNHKTRRMIRLTVIRHGETTGNAGHLCQGQQPGELSEKGKTQVKLLAQKLKDEPIDILYSSDLKRTIDTAQAIIACHPGLEIIPDPLLRERFMASWEGKAFPSGWKWEDLPHDAETNEDLLKRAVLFINKIMDLHDGKQVVAVSHGGMIRAFRTLVSGSPWSEFLLWKEAPNTSVSRFELHPNGKYSVLEVNNTDHLEVLSADGV
jgi:broad specificity phosphatase PhoE